MRKLSTKIKSPEGLRRVLASKKGVVFTNGCFDLLHKGHVTYLEQARKKGKILVVALNTDAAVKRLKGADRPINRLEDRLEVIAALESVDFVTWFDRDTPLDLILRLHPKVLVKGGDWKLDQIVGSREVLSWGGKVYSLPFVQGHSTSEMIRRARHRK